MKEVICTDAGFTADALLFYKQHGVVVPKQDSIYTIRQVLNHATKPGGGNVIGVLLEELKNPPVPVENPILGSITREVSWSILRFRNLDGTEINEKELIKDYAQISKKHTY